MQSRTIRAAVCVLAVAAATAGAAGAETRIRVRNDGVMPAEVTVDKMIEQHGWIRELDEWLAELLASPNPDARDLDRCLKQYTSLLQHHLIEEERDLVGFAPPTR